jgi:hypothetical protein
VRGGWTARCPAHSDENPSLSISEKDGRILLHCYAGCETREILAALGLTERDLFTQPSSGGTEGASGAPEAVYQYRDEGGVLLFEVVRFPAKRFRQRRPDGEGGQVWNLDGVRRVLYHLPEVVKAKSVLVVEGEKDADTAASLGFTATCNPGGAGKWQPGYSEFLRGKNVTIVCDADPPGAAHGREVARSLIGIAAGVKLIEALPGRAVKDVSDFLSQFPDDATSKKMLAAVVNDAPVLTPADVAAWTPPTKAAPGFTLTRLGDLMNEPAEQVSWLLEGVLPTGGLSLLAAKPKAGKSTFARCLALAIARGEQFLGRNTQKGAVICLELEEKRSEVRRHFKMMGATGEEEIFIHTAHAPADALPAVTAEIKSRKPVLLVIDPLLKFTRVKDGNDYAQVTAALEPLLILARENRVHVLLVHHLGKGERAEATDGILGSTALFAAVDTALIVKRSEKYRTIQSRQRYGEDLTETVLEFDADRRTLSLGASRSEADTMAASEEILKFLEGSPDGKTEPEITEGVEGKTRIIRQALRNLVKAGKVHREGGGKRGDPFKYGFSFSCSQIYMGTREQETGKAARTSVNIDSILVPNTESKSFLVPDIGNEKKEGEKPVENLPLMSQKPAIPLFEFPDRAQGQTLADRQQAWEDLDMEVPQVQTATYVSWENWWRSQQDKPVAERAAAWCDYLEAHARRIYGCLVSPELHAARVLADRITKGKLAAEFSTREVYLKGWAGLATPDEVRAALRVLEDAGWVRPVQGGEHQGRPSERWRVNPKVTEAGDEHPEPVA